MLDSFPELHDGFVKNLSVDEDKAVLGLASVDVCRFELMLDGVEIPQTEDFAQLNIIYSLEIVCGTSPSWADMTELLGRLFPAPHASVASPYQQRHADHLQRTLSRITEGDATMVVLRRSLGCELVAICRTAKLTRLGTLEATDPASPGPLHAPK